MEDEHSPEQVPLKQAVPTHLFALPVDEGGKATEFRPFSIASPHMRAFGSPYSLASSPPSPSLHSSPSSATISTSPKPTPHEPRHRSLHRLHLLPRCHGLHRQPPRPPRRLRHPLPPRLPYHPRHRPRLLPKRLYHYPPSSSASASPTSSPTSSG
ncbi:hypothetical protein RchiOBHm_Chr2g0172721 [Rosa chinensis]|uniref:Uncharacterized protein n=1 Tax=Rosa chinensis TaxID=74649 RepID=A0A2P6S5S5_ROSCH|nr:hypothetical protein RchiOBHm_Chr2g0172721 [Rosa chinensis]